MGRVTVNDDSRDQVITNEGGNGCVIREREIGSLHIHIRMCKTKQGQ